jgi:Na+-transporting NADH:ubiquinone oxidoreductase subunit C
MKQSPLHTLNYSVILGTVCALLLTGMGRLTAPYREANEKAEKMRNILSVLGVPFNPKASSLEMAEVFKQNVQEVKGQLNLYQYRPAEGDVRSVAVPFSGQGLWGPIEGYLALEPDMKTIRGVTFVHQEETPGLGGEIVSEKFRGQFKGKSAMAPTGEPGIHIRRGGGASAPNEVDAISGATLTCDKVEAMINAAIRVTAQEQKRDQ